MSLETNKIALEKLATFYPDKNLPMAFSDNPKCFGADIRVVGIKCSHCNKHVSGNNLKFCNFQPNVKCYDCQNL